MSEEILKIKDVSKLFNVSIVTIWKWRKQGFLRSHKMGRKSVFFLEQEVLEDLKKIKGEKNDFGQRSNKKERD